MQWTIEIECPACGGTGLHKGRFEKDGAAVICNCCHGSGKNDFTYNDFEGRKKMEGVTRVFPCGLNYEHSDHDIVNKYGQALHFSKYGCSYEDWEKGAIPAPMEELYCPHLYERELGNKVPPCSRCHEGHTGFRGIKDCLFYHDKEKCWEEWHKNKD